MKTKKDYNQYPFKNLSLEDMKGERWKDIPGYDGYIKVSNYGRIWSLARPIQSITGQFYYTKERIRKQHLSKYYNSYIKDHTEQLRVHLRYEGKDAHLLVNRLVYAMFVKPIDFQDDKLLIVHKDGDNCNNRAANLVPMNGTELYAHGLEILRRPAFGMKFKKGKDVPWSEANSPRRIVKYALDGKKIKEYESVQHAATANKTYRSSVRDVAMKRLKQLHGFVYRYEGDVYKGEYKDFSWEKPVTQYSVDGKKLNTYDSVKNASAKTGIDENTISKCALGKLRIGSGYVWRYEDKVYKGEYKGKIKNLPKPITQYSLDGKKIAHFESVNQASKETGFTAATLLDCAFKRTKVSHGYVWRFEGDSYNGEHKNYRIGKPVTQFTLEGKKIRTYPTITLAAQSTGLTPDNIQKNVKGENKTAGGFVWKYAALKETSQIALQTVTTNKGDTTQGTAVIQYTIEGKKLAYFDSLTLAAKACNITPGGIATALDHPDRTAAGFVWRTKGNRYYGQLAKKPVANKARIVTQYDLLGNKKGVFKSTKQAEAETGVFATTISAVARGKLKTTGGYIWMYGDGPKKINIEEHHASTNEAIEKSSKAVIKSTLKGKVVAQYKSIAEASRVEGISVSRISSVINGKTKSALGHYWKLA